MIDSTLQRDTGAMNPMRRLHAAPPEMHARELASRVNDGLQVTLLWHPARDAVSLSVADERTGEIFEFGVPRDRALHAFHHPFAYAA